MKTKKIKVGKVSYVKHVKTEVDSEGVNIATIKLIPIN